MGLSEPGIETIRRAHQLSWLLHQKDWIVPIPGMKTVSRLQENMSAAYVELKKEDWDILDGILRRFPAVGARYSEGMMRMVGR